jgi:phosphohistidine phosphatase
VPPPAVVFSSPYERAWATAALLESDAGWPAPRHLPALIPGSPPHEVFDAMVREAGDATVVALVGHEPDLHRLASYLLTGSGAALLMEWRKGGIACVRWDGEPRAGAARLAWQLPPRMLRRLGR